MSENDKLSVMIEDHDHEIENSPLCRSITRDGITVHVQIYRWAGSGDGWSLEVVDQDGGSTVWEETFLSDNEAYAEFCQTLEIEGICSFAERPSVRLH
jgi:hypothetical protein